MRLLAAFALAAAFGPAITPARAQPTPPPAEPPRNAVTGFGGWMTAENWQDLFLSLHEIAFEDAGLMGVALSRRVAEPVEGLSLEVEGQLVKHFGDQSRWEVNAPAATSAICAAAILNGWEPPRWRGFRR